jgi:hypothetical protein
MRVERVDAETVIADVSPLLPTWFTPEYACQPPTSTYPDENWIRRADLRYVIYSDDDPVGLALVRARDGKVTWLNSAPGRMGDVASVLCPHVFDDCGGCWGVIENPAVVRQILDVCGSHFETEAAGLGVRLRWAG